MSKTYDLSKKSDLNRLSRDLENETYRIAKDSIEKDGIEFECPGCHNIFQAIPGKNICPHCGGEIEVSFDFSQLPL